MGASAPLSAYAVSGGGGELPDRWRGRTSTRALNGLCMAGRQRCIAPPAGAGNSLAFEDLSGKDFRGKKFYKGDLRGTNFTDANLENASLFGAFAKGAVFKNANLANADLESVDFEGADLTGAVLEGAQVRFAAAHINDCTEIVLSNAAMAACPLDYHTIRLLRRVICSIAPVRAGHECAIQERKDS